MGYELVSIDEASFQLATNYKKIWFPKGEKPKGAFFWSNKKIITFGALTSSHQFYYDFYDSQNSLTFRSFLRNLFEWLDSNKKHTLILDNAGWHKTQCVKSMFEEQKERIIIEYIPSYSPELNPIETRWKVTKNVVLKSHYFNLEDFWCKHIFMQSFITYLCR